MSLHCSIEGCLFVVARKECGCLMAAATVKPSIANDLFDDYEHDPEYEIRLIPRGGGPPLIVGPCEHVPRASDQRPSDVRLRRYYHA